MFPDSKTPSTTCPNCEEVLNTATPVFESATPKPGDISVCAYCKAVLIFDENLNVRWPNHAEMLEILKVLFNAKT